MYKLFVYNNLGAGMVDSEYLRYSEVTRGCSSHPSGKILIILVLTS